MKRLGREYVVPVLVIVTGSGWLLNAQGVVPRVDWVWTCGLCATGLLTLAAGGLDRLTAVAGPLLVVSSICSFLRQTGNLPVATELPLLVTALGLFMLLARVFGLPRPAICRADDPPAGTAPPGDRD